jgi:hypothetical protein
MTEPTTPTKSDTLGPGSFCIPRAAFNALLDAKATVYEICAYLVLAKFTGECGRYSTASITAVNTYTGANKTKGGPIDRAITRLKTIRAKGATKQVSNGKRGKNHAMIEQATDLGPIVFDRETWNRETLGRLPLPDGPTERGKVLHVLPDFEEPPADRIWFGNNLVSGIGGIDKPLKKLKDAGDVAARLLLAMYAANDMETWGGVRPIGSGSGPWKHYDPVPNGEKSLTGGARLIRSKYGGEVASIAKNISTDNAAYWQALAALQSSGLIYEVVLVLNRNGVASKFDSGGDYTKIPDDAEPWCELDCRSQHGYKPEGEEGIGSATATTAGDFGHSVALKGGGFDGTYAAIVPTGYGAMIAGIYRLRFRVANSKNAGVKGAWTRMYQNNREAFNLVQSIRAANKLPPLTPPLEAAKAAKAAKVAKNGQTVAKSAEVDDCPF